MSNYNYKMPSVMKASELGKSHRCGFFREKNLFLNGESNLYFEKAKIIKDCIKALLKEKVNNGGDLSEDVRKEVYKNLLETMSHMGYKTKKTAEINAKDAYRQIMRYVLCETRVPLFTYPAVVDVGGMAVKVSPTMVFLTNDEVEVVKLSASKPKVTQAGKKLDDSANSNLELYAMVQYGKRYVPQGREATVKASFYYLRKNTDKPSENRFDLDFWDTANAGNVVSIEDKVIGGGFRCLFGCKPGCSDCEDCAYPEMCAFLAEKTPLDITFEPQIDAFKKGIDKEECTSEMCATCDFKHICNYNEPPIIFNKEEKRRSVADLELTETQEDAVYFRKGYARIIAGAGAGKTLVVALRVAMMLSEGIKPEEIIMMTYTNTGAGEMKERIAMYCEDLGVECELEKLCVTTFNAFGDEIIKKFWEKLGFAEEPRLIDVIERSKVIVDLLDKEQVPGVDYRNFDMNTMYVKGARSIASEAFSIIKKKEIGSGEDNRLRSEIGMDSRFISDPAAYKVLVDLYYEYDSILRDNSLYEYEDQNKLVFEYLRKNPYFLEDMGVKHIIVDEFQDSNAEQVKLLKEFCDTKCFESLMTVGDDAQAIFSFQGGDPSIIINLFDILGVNGQDIFLVENHRSTKKIIEFANKVIAYNKVQVPKDLIATREEGKPVVVNGFVDIDEEYEYILEGIKKHIEDGSKLEDIAFIGRSKKELMKLGTLLTKANIQWVMLSPELYIENSRVIAAIELAKAVGTPNATKCILPYLNCVDRGELMKRPTSEIKMLVDDMVNKLHYMKNSKSGLADFMSLLKGIDIDDEIYQSFLEKLSYRKSFDELITYCVDFEKYGENETTRRQSNYEGVVLTTAHSSKGLEWPIVYSSISKFYDKYEQKYNASLEETRRLLFVSATRARDELYITGTYRSGGNAQAPVYNKYLKECYEIADKAFNPAQAIEQAKLKKKAEQEALKDVKTSKAPAKAKAKKSA